MGGAVAAASGAYLWSEGAPERTASLRDPFYPGDVGEEPAPTVIRGTDDTGPGAVPGENTRPGAADFMLTGRRFGDDERGQVAGYAAATSVAPGSHLDFHISVAPAQRYRIDVYRLGHYAGAGARLVAKSPSLAGRRQAPPVVTAHTGMVHCDWPVGWRLHTGRDWVSGFYLALATNAAGWCRWIPFVVRDPARRTPGLVVLPTSTYQAYNQWPLDGRTGASLYYGFDANGERLPQRRSLAVSHQRPYSGAGIPQLAERDIGFVRWVESLDHDLTYATSEDLHTGRVQPSRYRAVVFCGHDEYWSVAMRRAVAAARNGGTSLVFLGANNCYWRVGYTGERVVACAKSTPRPHRPLPLMTQWRKAGSPEQALIGAQYVSGVDGHAPLVARGARHWFWAGTGLRDGDRIPGVVWGEVDQEMPGVRRPDAVERALLAVSSCTRRGRVLHQNTTLYRAPSGAWVFAAGSLGWTAALRTDDRIRRATGNLLDRVLRAPVPS